MILSSRLHGRLEDRSFRAPTSTPSPLTTWAEQASRQGMEDRTVLGRRLYSMSHTHPSPSGTIKWAESSGTWSVQRSQKGVVCVHVHKCYSAQVKWVARPSVGEGSFAEWETSSLLKSQWVMMAAEFVYWVQRGPPRGHTEHCLTFCWKGLLFTFVCQTHKHTYTHKQLPVCTASYDMGKYKKPMSLQIHCCDTCTHTGAQAYTPMWVFGNRNVHANTQKKHSQRHTHVCKCTRTQEGKLMKPVHYHTRGYPYLGNPFCCTQCLVEVHQAKAMKSLWSSVGVQFYNNANIFVEKKKFIKLFLRVTSVND